MDSMEFAKYILETARVAVVPGSAFGPSGEGFLRASFSTSYENLVEAADRMEKAVAKLK
jgi:aspartate/methionine/tyrosine aminotransferase